MGMKTAQMMMNMMGTVLFRTSSESLFPAGMFFFSFISHPPSFWSARTG